MLNFIFRRVLPILALAFAGSALGQTTVTLMQGLNGYTGTTDAWITAGQPSNNKGADPALSTRGEGTDSAVIRFAIFAAEGGPVPDGAMITSATLSFYKFNGPDAVFKASRLLKNWSEGQVTWNVAATGTSWTSAGANGSGSDYLASADGQGSVGDAAANGCTAAPYPAACWLNIDVTAGVQAFGAGTPNYGWKIAQVSSSIPGNYKIVNSSENNSFPSLRPKLSITYTVATGSSVTLMHGLNGYAGSTDSWMNGAQATTNKGADPALSVRGESTDSALIRFNIFAAEGGLVPDNAVITSATLSFYMFNGPATVMKASRLKKSWAESQVTWNNAATGSGWTTAGANSPGSDFEASADGQGSVGDAAANGCTAAPYPAACWLNIDVTAGVQAFKAGAPNHGWKIAQVSSTIPGNYKYFNSRENNNFPTLRPKLTVTYTTDACTPPTADLAVSSPNSGPAPLNVTFDASGSSPGTHPITNLRLQFGDGTTDVNWDNKDTTQPHTYNLPNGQKTATLSVTNQCGTSAPDTAQVTVGGPVPTAHLVPSPQTWPTAPLTVTFNASGSNGNGSAITKLRLSFGDGTPDVEWDNKDETKQHAYAAIGEYNAVLTVTNANGDSTPVEKPISIGTFTKHASTLGAGGVAVPTFHSMSLYFNGPYSTQSPPPGSKLFVRYRRATEDPANPAVWKEGYPLWFDTRTTNAGCSGGCGLPYTWKGRGSVVHLQPGTEYVFEVATGTSHATADWANGFHIQDPNALDPRFPSTWSETFNEGTTTLIPSQSTPLVIGPTEGGAPGAYRVYSGWNGSSRNVINRAGGGQANGVPTDGSSTFDSIGVAQLPGQWQDTQFAIVIKASYVIVRRVVVKGAAAAAILIYPNVTDVVIEDSEISDWSWRKGNISGKEPSNPNAWGTFGMDEAGGIHLSENNSRIVVQRTVIKDPHFGAFPWDTQVGCGAANNHPVGGMGITVYHGGTQNVFRYNEITGHATDDRRWLMDGISGKDNFGLRGTIGSDSDVYQNIIMRVFDDGIETEGDGRNVRVWGNYFDQVKVGIGATTVHYGPSYVWRNVFNRIRTCHAGVEPDADWGNTVAFKYGGTKLTNPGEVYGDGKRYIFNNTMLQQPGNTHNPAQNLSLGGSGGVEGESDGPGSIRFTTAHNNILHIKDKVPEGYAVMNYSNSEANIGSVFTSNVHNGKWALNLTPELNFKFNAGQLTYQASNWSTVPALGGNYQLSTNSFGRRAGEHVPNFTRDVDHVTSASKSGFAAVTGQCDGQVNTGCPDAGAHQTGAPAMKFGITAGQ
jgi:hypothetical protein